MFNDNLYHISVYDNLTTYFNFLMEGKKRKQEVFVAQNRNNIGFIIFFCKTNKNKWSYIKSTSCVFLVVNNIQLIQLEKWYFLPIVKMSVINEK